MSPDGIKHQRFRMADGRDGYGDGFDGYSGYARVSSQDGRELILMARSDDERSPEPDSSAAITGD
jgi:hypothetical protein